MFSQSAAFYDLIYCSFKNYEAEAAQIAELIHARYPACKTILDVACGTGEHARILSEKFGFAVDGIDLEPEFAVIAARKSPSGIFCQADMTSFELHKQFDVIMCLFSSIGYVKTLENVNRTLACFRRHLAPNGLIIVEPWFTPEAWIPGSVFMKTVEQDSLKVCRMGHSIRNDRITQLTFEYLIGRPDGITRLSEIHSLGLFTVEEMKGFFEKCGLTVDYDDKGISGRGLYVARSV